MVQSPPSFFPSHALDHAAAGIGAGIVTTLTMNPLDLLKVKFQVETKSPVGGPGKQIYNALRDIHASYGWKGLYRGVGANIAGQTASWGFYFLFYNTLKNRATGADIDKQLSAGQYLLYSAEASAVTAVMTNPLWVVRVRMFTTQADHPGAYTGLWNGLSSIMKSEGWAGLFRGTSLALFGVSNGAIQFMAYEKMKNFAFAQQRKRLLREGKGDELRKLPNATYTVMSATSKIIALTSTYPYQVIRSRLQNNAASHLYPTIRQTVSRTWKEEGMRGFYRGLGANLVRVLPGTCVTFVVYENLAWLLRTAAARRAREQGS